MQNPATLIEYVIRLMQPYPCCMLDPMHEQAMHLLLAQLLHDEQPCSTCILGASWSAAGADAVAFAWLHHTAWHCLHSQGGSVHEQRTGSYVPGLQQTTSVGGSRLQAWHVSWPPAKHALYLWGQPVEVAENPRTRPQTLKHTPGLLGTGHTGRCPTGCRHSQSPAPVGSCPASCSC